MHRRLQLAIALVLLAGLPAAAKVLAEGKPTSGGYYWQKIEKSNGGIQYMCRNKNDANIQKSAACNGAKAVKPK